VVDEEVIFKIGGTEILQDDLEVGRPVHLRYSIHPNLDRPRSMRGLVPLPI
jgi:hypothetical protein